MSGSAHTGIDDRRRLIDRGEQAVRNARETWAPLAVAMLSIDGIEAIAADDTDAVIVATAQRIRALVRSEDALGHYGDDGFAVIVHGGPQGAMELAKRLRAGVASREVEIEGGTRYAVTLSVGVAVFSPGDEGLTELLGRADGALDEAKRAGADRVVAV